MSLSKSSINSQQNFTAPNSKCACTYEFEDFRLDAARLMLYRNGKTVLLKPKVVETLVPLVEHPGEVISKDELMDRLWHDSFVEEANLSQNIYLLRKTLGKSADGRPLIETFWRRGYRFNGRVRQSNDVQLLFATRIQTLVLTEEETIDDGDPREDGLSEVSHDRLNGEVATAGFLSRRQTRNVRAKVLIAAGILIGGALLILGGMPLIRSVLETDSRNAVNSGAPESVAKMTRLTPDLNIESAVISPDGRYLAYDLFEKGNYSLWIKDIASGSSTQIMPPSDRGYGALHFSPDGAHIYYNKFLRTSPNGTIFRIPAFGGEPQAIAYDVISPQTFSPDGRQIAFVRHTQLVIANADGSGERVLHSRQGTTGHYESWGSNLSWSPDGTRIAICGSRTEGSARRRYELIEVSVADGTERDIPIPDWNYLDDVLWLHDQTGLIVRARETEGSPWQIWRVSYPNGEIGRITNDLSNYDDLSLSADSRSLVVEKHFTNTNIWRGPFDAPDEARQITAGNDANDGFYGIAFTPDNKIIYTSPRSRNVDLWMMNADGSEQTQLTKNAGGLNSRPRMTHDGRTIVFISSRTGLRQLWRMDADGGNPSQLIDVSEDVEADHPVLSPDAAWVYFNPFGKGNGSIAKIQASGGEITSVMDAGWPLSISPNGKLMVLGFYDKTASQPWQTGIMSLETGEMLKVFEKGFRVVQGWTADSSSLIVAGVDKDNSNLWLQPIHGGKLERLTHFESGLISNFAISPDFKQIAIARGNPSAEAILITDF